MNPSRCINETDFFISIHEIYKTIIEIYNKLNFEQFIFAPLKNEYLYNTTGTTSV